MAIQNFHPSQSEESFFTNQILAFASAFDRYLPWKESPTPYKTWVSEIILQQTRLAYGIQYFHKFIDQFPSLSALGTADEDELFQVWEGLGYYSRARNMLKTAKILLANHQGKFPETYDEVLALPGIGPYTAAAILSFSFKQPYAVVDGNVYRILSRFFGIEDPIDQTHAKRKFQQLADRLLARDQSDVYNQGIMDFGAVICKPKSPDCSRCSLSDRFFAKHNGMISKLPQKSKRIRRKVRYFNYLIYTTPDDKIGIRKRSKGDIWQDLYEFHCVELFDKNSFFQGLQPDSISSSGPYTQHLTHQTIHAQFSIISIRSRLEAPQDLQFVPIEQIHRYAFPKIIHCYFDDKNLTLF